MYKDNQTILRIWKNIASKKFHQQPGKEEKRVTF